MNCFFPLEKLRERGARKKWQHRQQRWYPSVVLHPHLHVNYVAGALAASKGERNLEEPTPLDSVCTWAGKETFFLVLWLPFPRLAFIWTRLSRKPKVYPGRKITLDKIRTLARRRNCRARKTFHKAPPENCLSTHSTNARMSDDGTFLVGLFECLEKCIRSELYLWMQIENAAADAHFFVHPYDDVWWFCVCAHWTGENGGGVEHVVWQYEEAFSEGGNGK